MKQPESRDLIQDFSTLVQPLLAGLCLHQREEAEVDTRTSSFVVSVAPLTRLSRSVAHVLLCTQ